MGKGYMTSPPLPANNFSIKGSTPLKKTRKLNLVKGDVRCPCVAWIYTTTQFSNYANINLIEHEKISCKYFFFDYTRSIDAEENAKAAESEL